MRVSISGRSDDLVHIYSIDRDGNVTRELDGGDEFGAWDGKDETIINAAFVLLQPDGTGAKIYVIYDGTWSSAIAMIEDDKPIPTEWTVTLEQEHAYSTRVVISGVDSGSVLARINEE